MHIDPVTVKEGSEIVKAVANHPESKKLLGFVADYIGFRFEEKKRLDKARTDLAIARAVQGFDATDDQRGEMVQKHLAVRAADREELKRLRQQANVENVTAEAIKQLPQGAEVHEPDPDWLEALFDMAGGISEPQMQAVWGRVLSTEATNPESFSVRTLNSLKLFSLADAETLRTLARFCFFGIGNNVRCELKRPGFIDWETLQKAASIGLVNMTHTDYNATGDGLAQAIKLSFCNGVPLVAISDKEIRYKWDGFPLTRLGLELLRLTSEEPDLEHVKAVANTLSSQGYVILATSDDAVEKYGYPREGIVGNLEVVRPPDEQES